MKRFFEKNGIMVVAAALLLTAVVSIGSVLIPAEPISNLIGILATPFRAVATAVTGWGEGVVSYASENERLREQVSELERQVSQMETENREATRALEENQRLRTLLSLREKRADFVFEAAYVTGRTGSSWESTLTIDKGSMHGVEEGDCVVTETGALVGIVSQCGVNWAKVTTVIDPSMSMGALVFRTGEDGILEGTLELMPQGKCRLSYLTEEAALVSGDEVLSSGMAGTYPSGLVIGHVDQVLTTPSGVERYAVLTPAAELSRLEEVFVIKDFDIVE